MNYKIKIALTAAAACAGLVLAAGQAYATLTIGSTTVDSNGALTLGGTNATSVVIGNAAASTTLGSALILQNGETFTNITDGGVILTTNTGAVVGGNANSSNALLQVAANTNDVANGVRQGLLSLALTRPSTNALTSWDGNKDIAMKISSYNSAANGTNGGVEGVEILARNTGTGATLSLVKGMNVTAENKTGAGTVQDSLTAMFTMKNNGVVANSNYGVEIQDEGGGTNPAATSLLYLTTSNTFPASGARASAIKIWNADNAGWAYNIDMNLATTTTADLRLHNGNIINNSAVGTITVGAANLVTTGKLLGNFRSAASADSATNATSPSETCDATSVGNMYVVDDTNAVGAWLYVCEQTNTSTYAWVQLSPDTNP